MDFHCKSCGSDVEPSAQFCGECGSNKDSAEKLFYNEFGEIMSPTCYECHVYLPPNKKRYLLMSRGGCLVDELEYCKECYKAELIERANRKEMYEEAAKAAKAECNKCRKPFTGIFRKKRYAVKGHGNMRNPTEFLCKDCFLALPKNDPWDGPPERIASDLWG